MKTLSVTLALIVAIAMPVLAEPKKDKAAQSASTYTRATKLQSDIRAKLSQTQDGIAQNLK